MRIDAILNRIKGKLHQKDEILPGIVYGTVPGRPGKVYVRLDDNSIFVANSSISSVNLPVWVRKVGDVYEVIGTREIYTDVKGISAVAEHGYSHSVGGDDPIAITFAQVTNGGTYPYNPYGTKKTTSVVVMPFVLILQNQTGVTLKEYRMTTLDLSSGFPTQSGTNKWALIYAAQDGKIKSVFGNTFSTSETNYLSYIPSRPSDCLAMLSAVMLRYDGNIVQSPFRNDILDLRFMTIQQGGTQGDYVLRSGDTMTGFLTLPADPTEDMHAATKHYVDAGDEQRVAKAGDTMTGALTLAGDPESALHAATKQYVDNGDAQRVAKSGDTMTGALTLAGDPTQDLHAATKQYVDAGDAQRVLKSGDTMTGPLTLPGDPTDALHAATKGYVDDRSIFVGERMATYFEDFLTSTSWFLTEAAINSGTATQVASGTSEVGVVSINSSTTANGGYRYTTHNSATAGDIVITSATFLAKIKQDRQTNVTVRIGFHNTINANAPTNGIFFSIINGNAVGNVVNSGTSLTTSSYTLSAGTWYIIRIDVENASASRFRIFSPDWTVLFDQEIMGNVPTSPVGIGVVATESSTTAWNGILYLDYIRVDIGRTWQG